jgi:hypothetical protein
MGKKRDLANKNIEKLIDEYVDTVESYNKSNCVKCIPMLGNYNQEDEITCIYNCESCKEYYYLNKKEQLRKMFLVE